MNRARGRVWLGGVFAAAVGIGLLPLDGVQGTAFSESACDDPGSALPVVVVHGFRSDAHAMSGLVAILEDTQIDVAVEAFDYGARNTSWVTHDQIGPTLREQLICLADASQASGGAGRVVVVGHSMGGLATRYALSNDRGDGRGVLDDEIALVATIGTPHEGSLWGILAGQAERGLQSSLTTQMWGHPQPLAGTFAGSALAVGSPQLAQLPDFPDGVPVLALASEYIGQARFLFYQSPEARVGDAVVSRSSALAMSREIDGVGGTGEITCRIGLPLELGGASISAAVAAELYANPAVRDCGHIWQYDAHRLVGEINTHLAVAANRPPRTIAQAPPSQSPAFEVAFVEAYLAGEDVSSMTARGDDAGISDLLTPDPSASFSVHSLPMLDPPQAPPGAVCALEGDVTSFCFVEVVRNDDEGRPAPPIYLQVYSSWLGMEYRGDGVVYVPDDAPLVIDFVAGNQYRPMTRPFDVAATFVRSAADGLLVETDMLGPDVIDQVRRTGLWESVERYSFVEVGLGRTGPMHRWGEPVGSACESVSDPTPSTRCVATAYQDGRRLATVAVDIEVPPPGGGPLRIVGVQELNL